MLKEWKEIEITNFKGESTRTSPERNECALCQNLDLRGISGEMVVTPKMTQKYAAPSLTSFGSATVLGMDTFHVTETPTRSEVTVQVQKGTLAKVTGSSPSIASINMVAVCAYPYWSGSAWVNGWKWLTRSLLTNLTSKSTYTVTAYGITKAILDTEPHWLAYNYTQTKVANVLSWDASNNIVLSRNDFTNGDTIIFMTNYVPWTYLTGNYAAVADDVSFIKPPSGGIRIAFGGYENRLTLAVKYWKHYGSVTAIAAGADAAYLTSINNYDELILDPYNMVTSPTPFYNSGVGTSTSATGQGWISGLDCGTNLFWVVTAVLDDYQEFAVYSGAYAAFTTTVERHITWYPLIRRGPLNKRFTKLRLYVALSSKDDNNQVASDYKLVGDAVYSSAVSGGTGWSLSSDGNIYFTTSVTITKQTFEEAEKELNSTVSHTVYLGGPGDGYITTDYVKSWDKALITGNRAFVFNPFTTAREINIAYKSVIESNGAANYDLIPPELRISLEGKDGNDILDVIPTPSNEILVSRNTNCQIVNPESGSTYDLSEGIAGVSRRSLISFGDYYAIPSKYDVYLFSKTSSENITEFTIREKYRAISSKSLILGVRDDLANSLCLYDGDATEHVFTPGKGWVRRNTSVIDADLISYSIDENGQILYLKNDGVIYYRNNSAQEDASISFEWQSVPFNVMMLPEIRSSDRFLVGYIAMDYVSPNTTMTFRVSLNGAAFGNALPTVPAGSTYYKKPIPGFIQSVKKFQISLAGTKTAGQGDIRIRSIKFGVQAINFGRWS